VNMSIWICNDLTLLQVIRMCTPIFCHVAKAAYLKRIETDTVVSFLDALRGLGVFCDTLFQQIVFKLEDGPLKNSISYTMGTHSRNFDKKMKSLKKQFIKSTTDATGIKHTVIILVCYNTIYVFIWFLAMKYMIRVRCAYPRGMKHAQSWNEAYTVMYTLSRGMKHAQSYILQMIPHWSLFP
jgi:hypothetical protein